VVYLIRTSHFTSIIVNNSYYIWFNAKVIQTDIKARLCKDSYGSKFNTAYRSVLAMSSVSYNTYRYRRINLAIRLKRLTFKENDISVIILFRNLLMDKHVKLP
jgi:hypothetical protein